MTMRAIRVVGGRLTLDARAQEPAAKPDDAIVRPIRVAIDPSRIVEAGDGVIPGTECVGEVVRGSERVHEGARVVAMPDLSCGACEACRGGLATHCPSGATLGTPRAAGCLAERFAIDPANLVESPPSVEDDAAALAAVVGRAMHAVLCAGERAKGLVTIIGDGATGLLAGQILHRSNPHVRVLWRLERSVGICERWRVPHRHFSEAGRRGDQDVVIDARGDDESLRVAMAMLKPRGLLVVARKGGGGMMMDAALLRERELQCIGSRTSLVREALALMAARHIDVGAIIGARCRFDDVPTIVGREAQSVRTLIEM